MKGTMTSNNLFNIDSISGYNISNGVFFDLYTGHLIKECVTGRKTVALKELKHNLLAYLLKNRMKKSISSDELAVHVWKHYGGIQVSDQRILNNIRDLNLKLISIGASEEIIQKITTNSYEVKSHLISPVHIFYGFKT